MKNLLLNLNSVRAVRELRAGSSPREVSGELGISLRNIDRLQVLYGAVPDHLLAGIERLLHEREKLRRLVSSLLHRGELLP